LFYKEQIAKKYFNNDNSSYKRFWQNIFEQAVFPYLAEISFVIYNIKESSEGIKNILPFTVSELEEWKEKFIDDFLTKRSEGYFEGDIENIYTLVVRANNELDQTMKTKIISHLNSNSLKPFLFDMINYHKITEKLDQSYYTYSLSWLTDRIFGTKDNFISKIEDLSKGFESDFVAEFFNFYAELEKNSFNPIAFHFEYIPVDRRMVANITY
jgi:hypothetical protein